MAPRDADEEVKVTEAGEKVPHAALGVTMSGDPDGGSAVSETAALIGMLMLTVAGSVGYEIVSKGLTTTEAGDGRM